MHLNVKDFSYSLPAEQIATYPLDHRDQSKLLVYNQGEISHHQFHSIAAFLPAGSLLIFNDTRVIPARLRFKKETAAVIEIFLLTPLLPSATVLEAMTAERYCVWKCTIGNLKRWNDGSTLVKHFHGITLEAILEDREDGRIRFSWNTDHTFGGVVSLMGETPLPPYLKRKVEESDRERYQTIYSRYEGAVAAPTAGLHFTSAVFESLQKKDIQTDFVTLHVSAGTFLPIKTQDASRHIMHTEQLVVSRINIENLIKNRSITAVGTTSIRTIESLYWYGVKLLKDPNAAFIIHQFDPYQYEGVLPSRAVALTAILSYMSSRKIDLLSGETSIYLVPGYTFRICEALVTNFHQPGSTLILLVAAFLGEQWKKVYEEALKNKYRFLSYGDSSLLISPTKNQKTS